MDMRINSELVRQLRLQRAWSQEHLAEVAGLGLRTIQRAETGGNTSFESARALAAVFEVHVDALLLRESEPCQEPDISPATPGRRVWSSRAIAATVSLFFSAIATLAVLTPGFVSAEQVQLDFKMRLEKPSATEADIRDSIRSNSSMVLDYDRETELDFDDIKLILSVGKGEDNTVLIRATVYTRMDGDYEILAKPVVLTKNQEKAMIRFGSPTGMMFELEVFPSIQP